MTEFLHGLADYCWYSFLVDNALPWIVFILFSAGFAVYEWETNCKQNFS